MDSYSDIDRFIAAVRAVTVIDVNMFNHFLRRGNRIIGPVGKQCHYCVSDVLIYKTAVVRNHGAESAEVGIDKLEVLFRGHILRQVCKRSYIDEKYRHLALDLIA